MRWLFAILLAALMPISAHAAEATEIPEATEAEIDAIYEEQKTLSGADRLFGQLPEDARDFVSHFSLNDLHADALLQLRFDELLRYFAEDLLQRLQAPFAMFCQIAGVVLLCAMLDTLTSEDREGTMSSIFRTVAVLFLCAVMLAPLLDCITRSAALLESSSKFMLAYIPVFASVLLMGGQTAAASAYHLTLFGAAQGVSVLISTVLVPFLYGFLAMCLAASVGEQMQLNRIAALVKKTVVWLLGIAMTLLMGFLTIQSLVAEGADTVSTKATRFVLSSAVPFVGSALSDALLTVKGCASLLRAGVGGFGMLIGAVTFLPMLAELAVWSLALRLGVMISALFGQKSPGALMDGASSAVGLLIAFLSAFLLLMTLSTTIVLLIGGAPA